MFDGFLGTRATFMLDFVFLAMFLVVPVMAWSIRQIRRQRYALHKRVQLALAAILAVAVTLFEIDIRVYGWRHLVSADGVVPGDVLLALYVHLVFAISSVVLWIFVVWRGLRHFSQPPAPGVHSRSHRFWGRLAAIDMTLTAVTGWIFYWLAFVR